MNLKTALEKIAGTKTLTSLDAEAVMDVFMLGQFDQDLAAEFLSALKARGETVEEIVGFARSIRKHATPITVKRVDLVDTCGTGGDGANTFNISTAVSLVVAGAGVGVAKHGNRSVSSRSGSADVYEALGLRLEKDPGVVARSIDEVGFGFLFAPAFHPAMKHVAPVRTKLATRTVFNILGPLVNPLFVKKQVLGVYSADLQTRMAQAIMSLGCDQSLVVHGSDGLDEFTLTGATHVVHIKEGRLKQFDVSPEDVGLQRAEAKELAGGSSTENALIIENILKGEKSPRRDIVVYNAAAALWISGVVKDLKEGVLRASKVIDQGAALGILEKLRVRQ